VHGRVGERNLIFLVTLAKLSIMRPSMCIGRAKLVFLVILVELSCAWEGWWEELSILSYISRIIHHDSEAEDAESMPILSGTFYTF
jgi:hypothetical protein